MRISDVIGHQTFEFLLPCRVPELQLVGGALVGHVFNEKINADCLLHAVGCTTLLASNCYWVNRSMIADLPTALLPRKTILYLTSHSLVLSSNIQLSIIA